MPGYCPVHHSRRCLLVPRAQGFLTPSSSLSLLFKLFLHPRYASPPLFKQLHSLYWGIYLETKSKEKVSTVLLLQFELSVSKGPCVQDLVLRLVKFREWKLWVVSHCGQCLQGDIVELSSSSQCLH